MPDNVRRPSEVEEEGLHLREQKEVPDVWR